jgi:hypothetical protein
MGLYAPGEGERCPLAYWCANFDYESVLRHGLAKNFFAMQYQYSHDGYDYQENAAQIAATPTNWRAIQEVKVGDWLAAYLKPSTFYAVGRVIGRVGTHDSGNQVQSDTVDRTLREHRHLHLHGVVTYSDSGAFYEDFTDKWRMPNLSEALGTEVYRQPDSWLYPQRIDVEKWSPIAAEGVRIPGLAGAAPFPKYRRAIFGVRENFFERISSELRRRSS